MLPDGSWIGPPMVVMGKPAVPQTFSPFETNRPSTTRYEAVIGEDKTLLRRLFEALPAALQKTVKSPPAAPLSRRTDSPVEEVLVFPTGGGWPVKGSRYAFAFADEDGKVGEGVEDLMNDHVGELVYLPAVLPRASREVSLLAWEMEAGTFQADFSKQPIAKMVFANPLHAKGVPPAQLWPDGKVEMEKAWRGRTVRLEKATRVLHNFEDKDKKKRNAGVDFDFVVEGARTEKDMGEIEWFLEDNRGNFFQPDSRGSSWGSSSKGILVGYSSSDVAFWPENLNWRLTLVLRPSRPAVMTGDEFRRIRIEHPRGKVEERVVEWSFEVNGAVFKQLRIAPDPKGRFFDIPEIAQWYVPAVVEFEVVKAPPGVFVELGSFYDGVLPFEERRSEIEAPKPLGGKGPVARVPVALDKQADFLEFVISVTREERLEFYFRPESLP